MGIIESRIFDGLGRELPGVRVDLYNENGTRIDTDVTPTQDGRPTTPGRFRFEGLDPGKYTIKAVGRGLDGYNRPDEFSLQEFTIIDDLASIGEAQILAKINDGTLETQDGARIKAEAARDEAKAASRPATWTPTAGEIGARPNDWTPTAAEVGARPDSWTPTKTDVGLGNVENKSSATIRSEITKANVTSTGLSADDVGAETPTGAQAKADAAEAGAKAASRPSTWTPSAEEVGARPGNWMPSALDVGADSAGSAAVAEANAKAASRPVTWTPTATDVGARPDSWIPSKADVGLGNVENKSSATIRSEITKTNVTATGLSADDVGAETPTGAQAKADSAEASAKAASRPSTWTPTKTDIGLGNVENKSSTTIRSEITKANVTATGISAADVGAETPAGAQSKADAAEAGAKAASRPATWIPSAEDVGADPVGSAASAEANAKAASRPMTWTPTSAEVGARPDSWTPTKAEIGLGNVENKSSAAIRSEITSSNIPLDSDLDQYAGNTLSGRVSRIPFQVDARDNGGIGGYHFWKFIEVRLPTSYDGVSFTGNLLTGSDDGRQTDHAVLQFTINTGNDPTALSNQKFNLDGEMSLVNGENLLRIFRTYDGTDYTYAFYAYCSNWYGLRGDLEITRSSQAIVKAWQRGTDTGTTAPSGDEITPGNKFADRSLTHADIAAARANLNVDQVENKSSATIRSEITKTNVTATGLAAGDIGAETPAGAQTKANTAETNAKSASRPVTWTPSAAEVGARPENWMPSANDVGARPSTWLPTKSDIGLGSVENKSSATIRSEITKANVTETGLVAADVGAETPDGAQTTADSRIAAKVGTSYEILAMKKGNLVNNPESSYDTGGWSKEQSGSGSAYLSYSSSIGFRFTCTVSNGTLIARAVSNSVKIDGSQLYRLMMLFAFADGAPSGNITDPHFRVHLRFFDVNSTEIGYRLYNPTTAAYVTAATRAPLSAWKTPTSSDQRFGSFLIPASISTAEIPDKDGADYLAEIPSTAVSVQMVFEWEFTAQGGTVEYLEAYMAKPVLVATSGGPRPVETVDPANIAFRSVTYSCWMTGDNYVNVSENYELVLFNYGYQGQTANIYLKLPSAANMKGRVLTFRANGSMGPGNAYLDPDGQISGQRLNGSTATVTLSLSAYNSFLIRSDGLHWYQVN